MTTEHSPDELLRRAEQIYDQAQVDTALAAMAGHITSSLANSSPVVLCLMNGGIVTTGHLLPLLDFPLQLDYLHATRYRSGTSGHQLEWHRKPTRDLRGRSLLIVDDILDEGVTLREVCGWCRDQGASEIRVAVLCTKRHDRCVDGVHADFSALDVPDRYVFGSGMDCYGWWRNAPGIFALNEQGAERPPV